MYYKHEKLPRRFIPFIRYHLINYNYNPSHIKPLIGKTNYNELTYVLYRELALRVNQFETYKIFTLDKIINKNANFSFLTHEISSNDNIIPIKNYKKKVLDSFSNIDQTTDFQVKKNKFASFLDFDAVNDKFFTSGESRSHFKSALNVLKENFLSFNAICYANEAINVHLYFDDLFGALGRLKICEKVLAYKKGKRNRKNEKEYEYLNITKIFIQLEIVMRILKNRDKNFLQSEKSSEKNNKKEQINSNDKVEEVNQIIVKNSQKIKSEFSEKRNKSNSLFSNALSEINIKNVLSKVKYTKSKKSSITKKAKIRYNITKKDISLAKKKLKETNENLIEEMLCVKPFVSQNNMQKELILTEDCMNVEIFLDKITESSVLHEDYKFTPKNSLFKYFQNKILAVLQRKWHFNLFNTLLNLFKHTYNIIEFQLNDPIIIDFEKTLIKGGIFTEKYIEKNIPIDDLLKIKKNFKNENLKSIAFLKKRLSKTSHFKNSRVPNISAAIKLAETGYFPHIYAYCKEKSLCTKLMYYIEDIKKNKDNYFPVIFKKRISPNLWVDSINDPETRYAVGNVYRNTKNKNIEFVSNKEFKNVGIKFVKKPI